MTEDQLDAIDAMEKVDELLVGMDSTMLFVGMGIENMANGKEVLAMLNHFRNTVLDARALLDDACGAIMRIPLTA